MKVNFYVIEENNINLLCQFETPDNLTIGKTFGYSGKNEHIEYKVKDVLNYEGIMDVYLEK
jgi:hypothetical protein